VSLDSRIEKLQETLGVLTTLKESTGWQLYIEAVNALIRVGRMASFGNDIGSLEDAFNECKLKAVIAGMQQSLATVDTLIDEADTDIKTLIEEREQEDA